MYNVIMFVIYFMFVRPLPTHYISIYQMQTFNNLIIIIIIEFGKIFDCEMRLKW